MGRKVLAVIAGYMVFAISSVLLFNLSGQRPHADAPLNFKIITILYGVVFSVIAGLVVQLIARDKILKLNLVLTVLMFLLAAISMFTSGGSHWTQLFAMFIFAPVSVLGGYLKVAKSVY